MIESVATKDIVVRTASIMRLLGDPTRIRLLRILAEGEHHVTWLCTHLEIAQPTVSHHLGLLRNAGVLQSRREGKQIHYSLNPEHVAFIEGGIRLAYEGVEVRIGDQEECCVGAETEAACLS